MGSPDRTPHVGSLSSLLEQNYPRHGAEDTAYDGRYDGDPGVPPVVAAFARDGQHGVGDARPQVTGRVDGVAGRTTEREPDAEDEQADEQRVDAAPYDSRGIASNRPAFAMMPETPKTSTKVPMISVMTFAGVL